MVAAAIGAGASWYLAQPRAIAVQTTPIVTVYPSQQYVVLNSSGYVVAQRKAAIASKATGRLEWLGVAEGSRVKAGEVIARLDNRDVVAQAESARAAVAAARAALEQARGRGSRRGDVAQARPGPARQGLRLGGGGRHGEDARRPRGRPASPTRKAAIAVAEANARNAQVGVDYTLIRAPFDGVILSKSANVGDMVTPFSSAADSKGAVVTMADMTTLEVEADVSESSLAKIEVGQPVEITLDALPDARFKGRISRIVPTVDRAKATVMTKVRFDAIDPRVLPEMSAKVSFLSREVTAADQRPQVAVNPDALATRDGRTVVFVVRDDRAALVPVTPGIKVGELTAIAGAVKTGEKAVLKPPADLAPDALVKVAAK